TSRLLDKQVIRIAGEFSNGDTAFSFTDLGWVVQQRLKTGLRQYLLQVESPPSDKDDGETSGEATA
ncbi:MAG TPA: hypothetical protein VF240_08765, partial [Pyrinomonadaceae bacterium]